ENAYSNVVILPLGDRINNTGTLLARLREDIKRATNLVFTNEAVAKFIRNLQDAGIDRGMTPLNYREIANNLSKCKRELDLLEAELIADQETSTTEIGERDTTLLKTQVEQAQGALTPIAQEIREEIEERVKFLEELSSVSLDQVWSSKATTYLKEWARQVEEALHVLRRRQRELEKDQR